MTGGSPGARWTTLGLGGSDADPDVNDLDMLGARDESEERAKRRGRNVRGAPRAELAGAVRIRHEERDYAAWYRVADDLLTVYCGLASNTGLLSPSSPSPKPLAERLLRELIEAEHPGLNPD